MKRLLIAASLVSLLAGSAFAQDAAPPPPRGDAGPAEAGAPPPPPKGPKHGPKEDRDRPGPREMRDGPPPPPSKAGHIKVDLGEDRGIDVKCADDEPMKACADIATALLDRVAPRP